MTNTGNTLNESRPWYREFWAWFVLSPLIVVVIVSSITVSIAVRNADDRVVDNYYKEGRMINMRLDEDLLAQKLAVEAELNFDLEVNELVLRLNISNEELPERLLLELSHPVQAVLDHELVLTRTANNQYNSELFKESTQKTAHTSSLENRWYLRLKPMYSDSTTSSEKNQKPVWRLRGEIDFSKSNSLVLKTDG